MMWEGLYALPFVLETKVIFLEHEYRGGVHERALALVCGEERGARFGLRGEVNVRHHIEPGAAGAEPPLSQERQADRCSFFSVLPCAKLAGDIAISAEIAAANAAELGSLHRDRIEDSHPARAAASRRIRPRDRQWRYAGTRNQIAKTIQATHRLDRTCEFRVASGVRQQPDVHVP